MAANGVTLHSFILSCPFSNCWLSWTVAIHWHMLHKVILPFQQYWAAFSFNNLDWNKAKQNKTPPWERKDSVSLANAAELKCHTWQHSLSLLFTTGRASLSPHSKGASFKCHSIPESLQISALNTQMHHNSSRFLKNDIPAC